MTVMSFEEQRGAGGRRIAHYLQGLEMRKLISNLGAVAVLAAVISNPLQAQAPAFSINPMRMEMEVRPGTERTAAFEIKAAPSADAERGRLILSLTDWKIKEDGSVTYAEQGRRSGPLRTG